MPEIKSTFSQGKMNKDFDERLVPKGQYRDAMNIEVSTSEGSDVGTVQNIKGNTKLPISSATLLGTTEKCIGTYKDEANNCAYFYLTNSVAHDHSVNPTPSEGIKTYRDSIWRLSHNNSNVHTVTPIIIDTYLEQHPVDSGGSYGGVTWESDGTNYTKVTLQAGHNVETGMWMFVSAGEGGIVRYIQAVAGNVVSFLSEPIQIAGYNYVFQGIPTADIHLTFTRHYPNISGHLDTNTLQYPFRFLRFDPNRKITGINVLDDFLLWTDNFSEPKKIHIQRCIDGTDSTKPYKTTKLIIKNDQNVSVDYGELKEENVTVIKRSPNNAPDLLMSDTRRTGNLNCNLWKRFKQNNIVNGRLNFRINPIGGDNPDYRAGDILLLGVGSVSLINYDAKLKVVSIDGVDMIAQVLEFPTAYNNQGKTYKILLVDSEKPLFENKFVRFATRWKYVDGEYSKFSPFSNAAFLPNDFQYDTLDAYNLGMTNKLKSLQLLSFIPNSIPKDVVEIDILCTESDSPIVYTVDTIDNESDEWNFQSSAFRKGKYKIESENIYGALPSNQILRSFDNVPRRALSQEIVGNRLVYGNYLQNYDLIHGYAGFGYYVKPSFSTWSQAKSLYGAEMLLNRYVSPGSINNGSSAEGWNWDKDEDTVTPVIGWALVDYYEFWYLGGGFQNYDLFSTQYPLTEYKKFWQNITNVKKNTSYKVEFRISNYQQGELQGPFLLSYDANNGTPITYLGSTDGTIYQGRFYGDGYYSVIVNTSQNVSESVTGSPTYDNFGANGKTFFFQARNGRGGIHGTPGGFIGQVTHFSVKEVYPSNKESVKSDREYQLGIVYQDKFGRQTPVLTDTTASFKVSKEESAVETSIVSKLTSLAPSFASHFKYYIKDTSSPYFNLAVDRGYQAEDNQVWLSFPSSERNKITEESYISLKKEHDTNVAVTSAATYKVISIENEAPEYIKQDRSSIVKVTGSLTPATNINGIFSLAERRPVEGSTLLAINDSEYLDETGSGVLSLQSLPVFTSGGGISIQFYSDSFLSDWYDIMSFSEVGVNDTNYVYINLKTAISAQDAVYIVNETGSTVTSNGVSTFNGNMYPDIKVNIAGTQEKTNLSEFVGKFFVKIRSDEFISKFLLAGSSTSVKLITASTTAWYLSDYITASGSSGVNGGAENLKTYYDLQDLNATPAYYELNGSYFAEDTTGSNENKFMKTHAEHGLSSAFAPFSGAIIYQGVNTYNNPSGNPQSHPWILRGSEGAKLKWDRLLKFTLFTGWSIGGGSAEQRAEFFIDNVGYVGILPDATNYPENGLWVDHGTFDHSVSYTDRKANMAKELTDAHTADVGNGSYSATTNCRFGRGIFVADGTETDIDGAPDSFFENGKSYMELGFSRINSTSNTKDVPPSNFNTPANWVNAWEVGSAVNEAHDEEKFFVDKLKKGNKFRFSNDPNEKVWIIKKIKTERRFNHTCFPGVTWSGVQNQDPYAFTKNAVILVDEDNMLGNGAQSYQTFTWADLENFSGAYCRVRANYKVGDYSVDSQGNAHPIDGLNLNNIDSNGYQGASSNYSIFLDCEETVRRERERFGLASNRRLTWIMEIESEDGTSITDIASYSGHANGFDHNSSALIEFVVEDKTAEDVLTSSNPAIFETVPKENTGLDIYYAASDWVSIKDHGNEQILPFFNCYSFGNGVESNRINDDFVTKVLDIDPVASTTIKEQYLEDRKKSGLIFSGIYNSNSDVNNLNQFVAAEKITKDLNPTYGSIQKLYTRNSDLLAFCEEKVIKILANKDALYNADGNTNLTSVNAVLGQSVPFSGEFGISTDPSSFAVENYRIYFTDKQKGAVLRLSMDGLSIISDYGMQDWFKDEFLKCTEVEGSYDRNKNEYNLTLTGGGTDYTLSFNESVKGWSSFKSFIPSAGVSISNNYYTFAPENATNNSYIWLHHSNDVRNSFYGKTPNADDYSSVTFVFNEAPDTVKEFKTLNYEGSRSYVNADTSDGNYYNLSSVKGWQASSISTDLQNGEVDEFVDKEGKWFNYIKGETTTANNIDTSDFTVQGLGIITGHTTT